VAGAYVTVTGSALISALRPISFASKPSCIANYPWKIAWLAE
jgi:hypothetical protein